MTEATRSDRPFRIRDLQPGDASMIAPLLADLDFPASPETIRARMQTMSSPSEMMIIAVREDEALGLLTVHLTPVLHRPVAVARLTLLVVAEHVRRRGVGRTLVETAEQRLADLGCDIVEVISNKRYRGAHGFYEHLGYELTSYKFKKLLTSP